MYVIAALPDGVHFVVGLVQASGVPDDGTLVHTFEGHTDAVYAVAVTPGGQHIVRRDKLVKVSVATKSLVSTCAGHTKSVNAVAAMPDKRILSGGSTTPSAQSDGTLANTFELHTDYAACRGAARQPARALRSYDKTVKLFNVNDGTVLRTFFHHADLEWTALLPDGLRFVSGSDDTACIVYHAQAHGTTSLPLLIELSEAVSPKSRVANRAPRVGLRPPPRRRVPNAACRNRLPRSRSSRRSSDALLDQRRRRRGAPLPDAALARSATFIGHVAARTARRRRGGPYVDEARVASASSDTWTTSCAPRAAAAAASSAPSALR